VAAVTTAGHLLLFALAELPEMARGKGNKIIGLPAGRASAEGERLIAVAVVGEGMNLTVLSGKRELTLKPTDLALYRGERGRRGKLLPRGFQRVDGLRA